MQADGLYEDNVKALAVGREWPAQAPCRKGAQLTVLSPSSPSPGLLLAKPNLNQWTQKPLALAYLGQSPRMQSRVEKENGYGEVNRPSSTIHVDHVLKGTESAGGNASAGN